jgi:hypothetical protein
MELCDLGYITEILPECVCKWVRRDRFLCKARCAFLVTYNPVQSLILTMKFIDAGVESDQQEKNNTRRYAD